MLGAASVVNAGHGDDARARCWAGHLALRGERTGAAACPWWCSFRVAGCAATPGSSLSPSPCSERLSGPGIYCRVNSGLVHGRLPSWPAWGSPSMPARSRRQAAGHCRTGRVPVFRAQLDNRPDPHLGRRLVDPSRIGVSRQPGQARTLSSAPPLATDTDLLTAHRPVIDRAASSLQAEDQPRRHQSHSQSHSLRYEGVRRAPRQHDGPGADGSGPVRTPTCRLGKRVGGNPSRVRISYPPPS